MVAPVLQNITPRQRMLNAYRGLFSDRYPVAPEFWYYYPARILKVNMMEFELEVPLWYALQVAFNKYQTEGWGAAFPEQKSPLIKTCKKILKISEGSFREEKQSFFLGEEFSTSRIYSYSDPSWIELYPVKEFRNLKKWVDMELFPAEYDFTSVNSALSSVGEDYLLEFWTGEPFFDFIARGLGFIKALYYFHEEDEKILSNYRDRFINHQLQLIHRAIKNTSFEAFTIGCSYSCNSLIGPRMWRKWDKPYIQAICDELHRYDKLVHIHFHGKSREVLSDFVEIGVDCVCPFERPPGGDIDGINGLHEAREKLAGCVTMNGNVHTVETLIRGYPDDVRREVQEIKAAFKGSPRLIIGTGDQVGSETPEENITAMIEEVVGNP